MFILLRVRSVISNSKPKCKPFSPPAFFSSAPSDKIPTSAKPSISTVVSALIHHRSKSRWRYLRALCPDGFDSEEFSLITLHLKNNPHLALRFFHWTLTKSLCNHDLRSYSTIIHILARARLRAQAQTLIRSAIRFAELEDDASENKQVSKPLKVFEILVKTYKRCGSAPFVFDLLIKALLDSKKVEASIQIVRMLRSRGISPQVGTLNSLISGVSRCVGANAGYAIYREVFGIDLEVEDRNVKLAAKIVPNVHTYNALMVSFYQSDSMGKVVEIWDQMEESKATRNSYSYSILMAAFCEENRINEAKNVWNEMRYKEVKPDIVAYNTMIAGLCKVGDLERAEEFFREMEFCGIESSCATYEHIITGHSDMGDVDSAMLMYKDMRRKHFRPDALTIQKLIRALCEKKRVWEALDVFRDATGHYNIYPQIEVYESLIKGLCQEGEMETACKLQVEMVGKGFRPNPEIFNAFIDGYLIQGNKEAVEMLRKEMLETMLNQGDK